MSLESSLKRSVPIGSLVVCASLAASCGSNQAESTDEVQAGAPPVTEPAASAAPGEATADPNAAGPASGPETATGVPPGLPPLSGQTDEVLLMDAPDEPPPPVVPPEEVVTETSTVVNEECASTAAESMDVTTVQPADIIFAIDTSRSMVEEINFVQTYMNEFSQQIIDSGIDVRVILIGNPVPADGEPVDTMMGFQGGNAQNGLCIAAPLGSGTCPEDENLPIYAHVTNPVGSNDALNVILDTFPSWQQHLRPEASKSFVIVSDDDATDAPNDSAATFTTNLQALAPELFTSWTFNGIFCGMECPPDSAAVGVVFQELVTQTAGVAGELCLQDFQPVFDRLAEQIITNAGSTIACEWELPAPPEGQTFSVDLVEVRRTTDAAGTVDFTRVETIDACGPESWHFDDPLNPTKILACPETCEAMQGGEAGSIDITFSCELVEGCAASSSSDVELAAGCAFPLPAPPDGVILDVGTVNVRYATPSGFGVVLGVVASAEECAGVEGGWYFDDPEEPTTITLCPDTCAAYEAGTVTNVQALFGCASKPAPPATTAR